MISAATDEQDIEEAHVSVTVRELRSGDFFPWYDVYAGYAEFYDRPLTDDTALLAWSRLTDPQEEVTGLVAVDESGTIVGLAHYRPFVRLLHASRGLYVDDLFVLDSARRQGVGRGLLEAVRAIATAGRYSVVRWITADDNAPAQELYDSVAEKTRWLTYDMRP